MSNSGRNPQITQWPNPYAPSGALAETVPRGWFTASNASVLTTQIMTATALYVPGNLPCTNLNFRTATTGNTVPTNWWFALYDASSNLIRQSTDQLAAAWAANTKVTLALDSIPVTAGARVASTTVTLTFPTLSESLTNLILVGDSVVVSNANIAAYNGTFTVVTVSATQITYVSGGSATDSLVAPFPTVQLAASRKLYRPATGALCYANVMFKGTVGTMVATNSFASFLGDTPVLAGTAGAALTGTAPSPMGAITAIAGQTYAYIS